MAVTRDRGWLWKCRPFMMIRSGNAKFNALRTTAVPQSRREPLPLIVRFRGCDTFVLTAYIFARRRHRSEARDAPLQARKSEERQGRKRRQGEKAVSRPSPSVSLRPARRARRCPRKNSGRLPFNEGVALRSLSHRRVGQRLVPDIVRLRISLVVTRGRPGQG